MDAVADGLAGGRGFTGPTVIPAKAGIEQVATSPGRGCGLRGSPHLLNLCLSGGGFKKVRFQLSLE
jgi:hypothetical protein